jgi:serine/threonine protein kinase
MEHCPYGDFFDLIKNHNLTFDDKMARTYFRQLISGIEYLHYYGIAHLDLKPENILLSEDFKLKIIDFDLSYKDGDKMI